MRLGRLELPCCYQRQILHPAMAFATYAAFMITSAVCRLDFLFTLSLAILLPIASSDSYE